MTDDTRRQRALAAFASLVDLPPLARLTQRGRDPLNARYTLELADGRELRVGTIKTLWSQTEFYKVVAVTLGMVPYGVEQADWRKGIRALINHGTEVIETPGEAFEDTVRDWISAYAGHASSADRDGAAASGAPFIEEGLLHIHAGGLARFVRRELIEQVKLPELYQGLRDLGFERRVIHYVRDQRNSSTTRTTASYYRAPLATLDTSIGDT